MLTVVLFAVAIGLAFVGLGYLSPQSGSEGQATQSVQAPLLVLAAVASYAAIQLSRRRRLADAGRRPAMGLSVDNDLKEETEFREARYEGAVFNLLAAAAGSPAGDDSFIAIAKDFLGEGGESGSPGVAAVQRRLAESEEFGLLELAETLTHGLDMNDAARNPSTAIPQIVARPPLYLAVTAFRRHMAQLNGRDNDDDGGSPQQEESGVENLRLAISSVTAEACVELREQGLRKESIFVLMMGGHLYLRAQDWWQATSCD